MRKFTLAVLMLFLVLISTGCGKKEVYDNGDYLKINVEAEQCTIPLLLLTREETSHVEVEAVDGFEAQIIGTNYETQYKDYQVTGWEVILTPTSQEMIDYKIDEITLTINGKSHEVKFKNPITYTYGSDAIMTTDLLSNMWTSVFDSKVLVEKTKAIYELIGSEGTMLSAVKAKDFLLVEVQDINGEPLRGSVTDYPFSGATTLGIAFQGESEFDTVITNLQFISEEEIVLQLQVGFEPELNEEYFAELLR